MMTRAISVSVTTVQSEPSDGNLAQPVSVRKSNTMEPTRGRAGSIRNTLCSRTTFRTSSPLCWPEKCHFLSRLWRRFCRLKRARPERQMSSSLDAAFFGGVLLLIVSPRFRLATAVLLLRRWTPLLLPTPPPQPQHPRDNGKGKKNGKTTCHEAL